MAKSKRRPKIRLELRLGYLCEKLSNLVEIWQSSDKNMLGHFSHIM